MYEFLTKDRTEYRDPMREIPQELKEYILKDERVKNGINQICTVEDGKIEQNQSLILIVGEQYFKLNLEKTFSWFDSKVNSSS